jgi:capsular polysaccharide transport system permease protein
MQDLQTRFGNNYFSVAVCIGWPLFHLLIILVSYTTFHEIAPLGSDPAVFAAVGLIPYILCMYQSRVMALSLIQNRPMLNIPVIRPIHLIFARVLSESIVSLVVVICLIFILFVLDMPALPHDLGEGLQALFATIYLGVGFGIMHTLTRIIAGMFGYLIFIGLIIFLYLTSGIFIPAALIPEKYTYYMAYNPIFQSVQWLRYAYYAIDDSLLDRYYIFIFSSTLIMIGLFLERAVRGLIFR